MIPEDAVEAAAKAAWVKYGVRSEPGYVRTLLEAAAPHMNQTILALVREQHARVERVNDKKGWTAEARAAYRAAGEAIFTALSTSGVPSDSRSA